MNHQSHDILFSLQTEEWVGQAFEIPPLGSQSGIFFAPQGAELSLDV